VDYRAAVGGLWNEIGKLQFDFMVAQGLKPRHKLLDIGCGCLRGGVHFINYLDEGNYYGIDKNTDLLKAGMKEAKIAGLGHKLFHLELDGSFNFSRLDVAFDFAIAQSLFTHLNLNEILLCLINLEKVLKARGRFYATYFHASKGSYGNATDRSSTDEKTIRTLPAFGRSIHYTLEMLQWAGWQANLRCTSVDEWDHPRYQRMVMYSK
jgi:ubiquinone/menaquinone biosynthesis C-methylase UbiE